MPADLTITLTCAEQAFILQYLPHPDEEHAPELDAGLCESIAAKLSGNSDAAALTGSETAAVPGTLRREALIEELIRKARLPREPDVPDASTQPDDRPFRPGMRDW